MLFAGGTGGHVMPALAVALKLREQGQEVLWVGSRRGLENRLAVAQGFSLKTLPVGALRGLGAGRRMLAVMRLAWSLLAALGLVLRFKPDLVLGMGSYVSAPGGLAAWLLGKPLVIQEQNAVPGLTNRMLSRFASRILTAFPAAFANRRRVSLLGNPVRDELCGLPLPEARMAGRRGPLRLLVLGGSQGARLLNDVVPRTLHDLPEGSVRVWHQTGAAELARVGLLYPKQGSRDQGGQNQSDWLRLDAFIDDMAEALGWADLVLCRAGALTLAELCAVGLGAVLVPYALAADDHQMQNARYLEQAGAALVLSEGEFSAPLLQGLLVKWQASREALLEMARKARGLGLADRDGRVAAACLEAMHA